MKPRQTAIVAIGGMLVLTLACLGLNLSPIRVQVDGWQLEVIRLIEKTPTATQEIDPQATNIENTAASASNDYIVTDRTWKFSRTPKGGWERPDYDDSGWSVVEVLPSCNELPGAQASCIWDYPYRYVEGDTLYIRKVFNLPEVPPRARLIALVDDDVDIFLNDELVLRDLSGGASFLEGDVTSSLRPGANVLVLRGIDYGEGIAYVQSVLGLCYNVRDQHAPLITIMNHWENWFDGKVYITAADAPCDSGIAEIAYQVDEGAWQVVQPHQIIELPPGEHDVRARATDRAGKQSFDTWHFRVGPAPAAVTASTPTPAPLHGDSEPQAEQARLFAEPILAAIADRSPDFEDDFSDPTSGWTASTVNGQSHAGELGYADGEYFLVAPPASSQEEWRHGYVTAPVEHMADFILEVDARFISTKEFDWESGFFYVSFQGRTDTSYMVAFDTKGNSNLAKYPGPRAPAIDLAINSTAPVKPLDTNQLRIVAKGSRIAAFLNGQSLFIIEDKILLRGYLSLGVANRGDLPLRMQVDNVKLWDIADLP